MAAYGDKIAVTTSLEVTSCCVCGIMFAISEVLLNHCKETGAGFHCPNGHTLSWSKTPLKEAKAQLVSSEVTIKTLTKEKTQAVADLKTLQTAHNKDKAELLALREAQVTLTLSTELLMDKVKNLQEEIVRLRTPKLLANGTPKVVVVNPPNARETTLAYLLVHPEKGCKEVAAALGVSQQLVAGVMAGIQKTRKKHNLKVPSIDK